MAELSPERRILLAFALAFLVLLAWSAYMRSLYPQPEPGAAETPPVAVAPPVIEKAPPAAAPPAAQVAAQPAPATPEVRQGTEERSITVDTREATIIFSTRGAVVRSWRLKKFRDHGEQPVELAQGDTTHLGYPLSLALADPAREEKLNTALYVVSPDTAALTAPGEMVFQWSDGELYARKRFRFEDGYLAEVETQVLEAGRGVEHSLAWRGGFGENAGPGATRGVEGQVFVRSPAGLQRQPARLAGQESGWLWKTPSPFPYTGEAAYAGIEDQYFVALFLPRRPQLALAAWSSAWTPEGADKPLQVGALAVGAPNGNTLRLYVGPKDIDVLGTIEPTALASGLRPALADELVDFGWFWWVAKPLFLMMKWLYEKWIPNYGWVIVVLTVAINILLFPLRWKSMESSFKMQKAAPQVKAIQDRYKQYKFNDPRKQQMQEEIMAIYREQGVNPLGGCLPLVLQLPFFYGFYKVLALSIEMRHAPWVLWIRDLSQKDPYYVLPVTMAITMWLSMKMTPMTMTDPRQQRMMQIMMLVFALAFLQVSAGLVLYWLVSSVVGVGQQYWINQWQKKHELARKEALRETKKKKHKQVPPGEGESE